MTTDHVCDACGRLSPGWSIVSYGTSDSSRDLCPSCSSLAVAERLGLDSFEPPDLEPETFIDFAGARRTFHLLGRLVVTGYFIDAFELEDGHPAGYRISAMGPLGGSPYLVLAEVRRKIRSALSYRSMEHHPDGTAGLPHGRPVFGTIDRDPESAEPVLVIDGKTLAWYELAELLGSYEGWQIRLEIRDRTEGW